MTLTEAAYWTRRFGVLAIGAFALFIIVVFVILSIPKNTVPSEYQKPNFACTNTKEEFLPSKLSIPSLSLSPGSDLVYEVETPTGKAESLPRVINVHKYTITGQSLNSQGEAKLLANRLGFNPDSMQRRGTTEYTWYDSVTYRTLVVEARNLNFTLTTDFTKSNAIDRTGKLPSDTEAQQLATNFLRSKGLLSDDMMDVKPYIVPVNILPNGSFNQAKSRSEAELIRVTYYRKKSMISIRSDLTDAASMKKDLERKGFVATLDNINTKKGNIEVYNFDTEAVYENMYKPNITVYIGTGNNLDKKMDTTNRNVYGVSYAYWPVDELPCGTYPLIPASTALDAVQKGKGSLIYLNDKNGDEIVSYIQRKVRKFTIYDINIKYYESEKEQKFLQPVYVVSGEATFDNGTIGVFHYYVPAVDYDSIGDKVVTPTTTDQSSSIF